MRDMACDFKIYSLLKDYIIWRQIDLNNCLVRTLKSNKLTIHFHVYRQLKRIEFCQIKVDPSMSI